MNGPRLLVLASKEKGINIMDGALYHRCVCLIYPGGCALYASQCIIRALAFLFLELPCLALCSWPICSGFVCMIFRLKKKILWSNASRSYLLYAGNIYPDNHNDRTGLLLETCYKQLFIKQ